MEVLFIGAGVRGAKKLNSEYQPYIKINGKTCIEHVVRAACNSNIIKKIYIWGEKNRLELILKNAAEFLPEDKNLLIFEEKQTPFESFLFTYLDYIADDFLKKVIKAWNCVKDVDWNIVRRYGKEKGIIENQAAIILSDTPLISSAEIDYMISHTNPDLDVVMGRTLQSAFEDALKYIDDKFIEKLAVKNFYKYVIDQKEVGLIVNSFFAGKPLKLEPHIWETANNFFENRTIISGNKANLLKIKKNYNQLKEFLFSRSGKEPKSAASKVKANIFLLKSFITIVNNLKTGKKYKDLTSIFSKIETAMGLKMGYQISRCVGAAFDMDTPYETEFIKRNFDKLKEKIQ